MRGGGERRLVVSIVLLFLLSVIILSSGVTASFSGWFKTITGRATGNVDFNISVTGGSAPQIIYVWNNSGESGPVTLSAGPTNTTIRINFSVSDADGHTNIDSASGRVNLTRSGEPLRTNSSCVKTAQSSGTTANFTCIVIMSWYDGDGLWNISANASDVNGNKAVNGTTLFNINTLTGFSIGPGNLTFSALTPGATNSTDSVDGILLNNTGNQAIGLGRIDINSTNLRGETTTTQAIYTGNISVGNTTASSAECSLGGTASQMNLSTANWANVTNASLEDGNFQYNNNTAQENLYVCIMEVGSELSSQSYSTQGLGSWIIRITV